MSGSMRALGYYQGLLSGEVTSQTLQEELGLLGGLVAFKLLIKDPGSMRVLAQDATAMDAIAGSPLALAEVASSAEAMAATSVSPTAVRSIVRAPGGAEALAASPAGVGALSPAAFGAALSSTAYCDALASNVVSLGVVLASAPLSAVLVAHPKGLGSVLASAASAAQLAASGQGMAALVASPSGMAQVGGSPTGSAAILASANASSAVFGSPSALQAFLSEGSSRATYARSSQARRPDAGYRLAVSGEERYLEAAGEKGMLFGRAAANGITGNFASGLSFWSSYTTGGSTGTTVNGSDPLVGTYTTLSKTGGGVGPGDRYGRNVAGLNVDAAGAYYYTFSALIRVRAAGASNFVLYCDAGSPQGGLVTASATVSLASVPLDTWIPVQARGYVGGKVLTGTASIYAWLQDGTGGVVDVAMPTFVKDEAWVPAPIGELAAVTAESLSLVPSSPVQPAEGMLVARVLTPGLAKGIAAAVPSGYAEKNVLAARLPSGQGIEISLENPGSGSWALGAAMAGPEGTVGGVANDYTAANYGSGDTWATVAVAWSKALGFLRYYVNGVKVDEQTGLTAGSFPEEAITSLEAGGRGGGTRAWGSALAWVARYSDWPGDLEAQAASSSQEPPANSDEFWNLRDGDLLAQGAPAATALVGPGPAWGSLVSSGGLPTALGTARLARELTSTEAGLGRLGELLDGPQASAIPAAGATRDAVVASAGATAALASRPAALLAWVANGPAALALVQSASAMGRVQSSDQLYANLKVACANVSSKLKRQDASGNGTWTYVPYLALRVAVVGGAGGSFVKSYHTPQEYTTKRGGGGQLRIAAYAPGDVTTNQSITVGAAGQPGWDVQGVGSQAAGAGAASSFGSVTAQGGAAATVSAEGAGGSSGVPSGSAADAGDLDLSAAVWQPLPVNVPGSPGGGYGPSRYGGAALPVPPAYNGASGAGRVTVYWVPAS